MFQKAMIALVLTLAPALVFGIEFAQIQTVKLTRLAKNGTVLVQYTGTNSAGKTQTIATKFPRIVHRVRYDEYVLRESIADMATQCQSLALAFANSGRGTFVINAGQISKSSIPGVDRIISIINSCEIRDI